MPYIGAGIQRFNTADNLTVTGTSELKNDVTVTGDVTASGTVLPTGDTAAGDAAALGFTSAEGLILTGQGSTSDVVIKNDADTTVCFVPTGTDDLKFNDNAALIFGTGDDFKISHNGSKTKIEDTGTGNLEIRGTNIEFYSGDGGETLAKLTDDGAAELYHDNTKRIETTSSGVAITGGFTTTDSCTITVDDNADTLVLKSTDADGVVGPILVLQRDSGSPADNDALGFINFTGDDDGGTQTSFATMAVTARDVTAGTLDGQFNLSTIVNNNLRSRMVMNEVETVFNQDSDDIDFRVESNDNANCFFVDAGNDKIGIRTGTPQFGLSFSQGTSDSSRLGWHDSSNNKRASIICSSANDALSFHTGTSDTERMRIDSGGSVTIPGGDTSPQDNSSGNGLCLTANGEIRAAVGSSQVADFNRMGNDGTVVLIRQAGTAEGSIEVNGSTVSLNGGHLSRWSQTTDGQRISGLLRGTVMTNLDQMAVWSHDEILWTEDDELPDGVSVGDVRKAAYTEDNEQLNCMAVSSVEGDVNVAGVFQSWDESDDFNDMTVAMTGDFIIRIAQGTTVARGDLLMSAGDGTAKPQGDDIVRSKTIAKVTSTTVSHTYDDGSYLVPCVLMAC